MGATEELDYLKSLVSQLNQKIAALENKPKAPAPAQTPAQQLRTILMGPPGAGTSPLNLLFTRLYAHTTSLLTRYD